MIPAFPGMTIEMELLHIRDRMDSGSAIQQNKDLDQQNIRF